MITTCAQPTLSCLKGNEHARQNPAADKSKTERHGLWLRISSQPVPFSWIISGLAHGAGYSKSTGGSVGNPFGSGS